MKKRVFSGILVFILLLACLCPAALAAGEINVTVNGEAVVWTDVRPFIDENNRTLCPLRAVAETMGLDVTWDPAAREAIFSTFYEDETGSMHASLHFPINSRAAYGVATVTDKETGETWTETDTLEMDTAAVIVDNRTYAPVRYLAEAFGYNVDWDAATRTVLIEDYVYEGTPIYMECYETEITDDYVTIFLSRGELFDEILDYAIGDVTLNGVSVETAYLPWEDVAYLSEYYAADLVGAFVIYGDFSGSVRELAIDLYLLYDETTEYVETHYMSL